MKELVIISFLSCFDWVMDLITRGQWGEARSEQRVVIKIRKQN